jgi:hypothetical protein
LKIELTENKNELFIKVTTNKIVKNSWCECSDKHQFSFD